MCLSVYSCARVSVCVCVCVCVCLCVWKLGFTMGLAWHQFSELCASNDKSAGLQS